MIQVREYLHGDERYIPEREYDWHRDFVLRTIDIGHVRTFEWEGKPVVIMGALVWPWGGVADVWSLVDYPNKAPAITLVREVRKMLQLCADTFALRRINASAATGEQLKWCRLLGFLYESTMERAAPDGGPLYGLVKFFDRRH